MKMLRSKVTAIFPFIHTDTVPKVGHFVTSVSMLKGYVHFYESDGSNNAFEKGMYRCCSKA